MTGSPLIEVSLKVDLNMFNYCTVKNFDIFQRAHTVPAKTVVIVRTQDPRTCARARLGIQETSVK